ncbi:MAG: glycosyltransferase [Nitrospirae bacterium]|nr:glycosyltransferase [Nitrospirota bacterium]
MRISLIIPTRNAGTQIETLLSALSAQNLKPFETIVIDSSSEDETVKRAKRFHAKTIVIPKGTFNHGKTRNTAAGQATGDILVFMTQDAVPLNDTLLHHLTVPFESQDVAASYGRHIPRSDASPLEAFARRFNYPASPLIKSLEDVEKYGIKTFFFSNVCSAVRRDAFLDAGMFPDGVRANEDMLLAAKLILKNFKVAYVPEAMVIHSHAYSLSRLFARYYNIGSSLKNNDWVLKRVRSEGEGLRFMKEQFRFLLEKQGYSWIPYALLEAAVKYAGYRIGLITG